MIDKLSVAVLLPQKVEHSLHRVESDERSLYKLGIPVAHCSIPQARKFLSLQRPSLETLLRDETGLRICMFQKIIFLTFIVLHCTYKIYGLKWVAPCIALNACGLFLSICAASRICNEVVPSSPLIT